MKTIHMLCNAHIDPVWQWNVEEGVGVALSTFRSAAMLCERNEAVIFNHNEALLYRWVEAYEPSLFARVQALVAQGRWHIMGGFELQPDCVMPGGESMVRQIIQGRAYFREKFGAQPRVAVSMDAFGHSRGLVQILAKCCYDGYLFMRPGATVPQTAKDFVWEGTDGSRILAHRLSKGYNTAMGKNRAELEAWLQGRSADEEALYPWGVGNHGGGPSQKDIDDIAAFTQEALAQGVALQYSTPETYLDAVRARGMERLHTHAEGLYPSNVGCYTSMLEIKQAHRRLEGAILQAEKLASIAELNGWLEYPRDTLREAWKTLSFLQFHDVLPGTCTQPVMRRMLERSGHGMELAASIAERVFFHMAQSEPQAAPDTIPILVCNPHPHPVREVVRCEFMLPDQNRDPSWETYAAVTCNGKPVASQMEKEDSNIPIDWRKRVTFLADLPPASVTRFDCTLHTQAARVPDQAVQFVQSHGALRSVINPETGLLDAIWHHDVLMTGPGLGQIEVYADNCDPWHMEGSTVGRFLYALPLNPATPVRTLEDGPVRAVVEAQFEKDGIGAVMRYAFPKQVQYVEMEVILTNTRPDTMIRMAFPAADKHAKLLGETMFGEEALSSDGAENVSQRYDCLIGEQGAFGVINDGVYGGCYTDGVLHKSLLRSPVYCAHPIPGRETLREDRFHQHMGIGTYTYRFRLCFFAKDESRIALSRQAQCMQEPPLAVSYFPAGETGAAAPKQVLVQGDVLMTAFKQAEDESGLVIRLAEPVGRQADFKIMLGEQAFLGTLSAYEAATFRWDGQQIHPCGMLD